MLWTLSLIWGMRLNSLESIRDVEVAGFSASFGDIVHHGFEPAEEIF